MSRSRQAGISLIEIMLVVLILGVVLALLIPMFVGTMRTASFQTGLDASDRTAARLMTTLRSSLRSAQILALASSPDLPAISYRVPDAEGDLDEDGEVRWGPIRRLAFEAVETIDEAKRGIDLNGDGDRADRFLRCRMVETVGSGDPRPLTASSFVLDADAPYGDVNDDGLNDRPFTAVPGGLRVILWSLVRADMTGLRQSRSEITLRNPQGDAGAALETEVTDEGLAAK